MANLTRSSNASSNANRFDGMLIVRYWKRSPLFGHPWILWASSGIAHRGNSWTWALDMIPSNSPRVKIRQVGASTYIDIKVVS